MQLLADKQLNTEWNGILAANLRTNFCVSSRFLLTGVAQLFTLNRILSFLPLNRVFRAVLGLGVGLVMLWPTGTLRAQTQLEILNADVLSFGEWNGKKLRRLVGNVQMKQDSLLMYCDSAWHFTDENVVEAYSNVRAWMGDSVRMTADFVRYEGDPRIAFATGRIVLTHNTMQLFTPKLYYFRNPAIGRYTQTGELRDTSWRLFSRAGTYYVRTRTAAFRGKVRMAHVDFDLMADTLRFHTQTSRADFDDTTFILDRKCREIRTVNGYFFLNQRRGHLWNFVRYRDSTYELTADTVRYDDSLGLGRANCSVVLKRDTTLELHGEVGYLNRKQDYSWMTDHAWMVRYDKQDTLLLFGDTLYSQQFAQRVDSLTGDTVRKQTRFRAFPRARFAARDMAGRADSVVYYLEDSLLRMFHDPILFNPTYQVTGDTITLWQRRKGIDSIKVGPGAFAIAVADSAQGYFNQSRSKMLYGKLAENKLIRLHFVGNCENLYWLEDQGKFKGLNKAFANAVTVHLRDNQPRRIVYLVKPEATFFPLHEVDSQTNELEGFRWRVAERPSRYVRYVAPVGAPEPVPEAVQKPSGE